MGHTLSIPLILFLSLLAGFFAACSKLVDISELDQCSEGEKLCPDEHGGRSCISSANAEVGCATPNQCTPCYFENADAKCVDGSCVPAKCVDGFHDCDSFPGCETFTGIVSGGTLEGVEMDGGCPPEGMSVFCQPIDGNCRPVDCPGGQEVNALGDACVASSPSE